MALLRMLSLSISYLEEPGGGGGGGGGVGRGSLPSSNSI
jgi:hypothetical protein